MATKDETLTETDDDLDIVEVDAPPGEEAKAAEAAAAKEASEKEDDPEPDEEHEDEGDHEDARLAEQEDDEDGEERKKRLNRRRRQKDARDRTIARLEALERENADLKRRVGGVETSTFASSQAQVESRLAEVRKDIATADAILAQAIKDADGDSYATAMRLRDEAKEQERELADAKKTFETRTSDTKTADPRVADYASQWKSANPWYRADGSDNPSAIVNAIDAGMIQQGYDPATREYWAELTKRVGQRLHPTEERRERKENGVDKDTSKRRAPPLGANRDGNGSARRQVYLSKERVDAMKSAGIWDDPSERAKMIKAYEEYDRDNSASR